MDNSDQNLQSLLAEVKKNPTKPEAYYQYGFACYNKDKLELALNNLKKSVDLKLNNQNLSRAFLLIGEIYKKKNMLKEASQYFEKSLSANPQQCQAYNNFGLIQLQNKKYDKALEYFQKALQADPNQQITYNNMGLTLIKQKKYNEAESYLLNGLQINPQYTKIYCNLGEVQSCRQNYEKAENYFKKAVELSPNDVDVIQLLGDFYENRQNFPMLEACFQRVIKLKPNCEKFHRSLARAYYYLQRYPQAQQNFKRVLQINPKNTDSYYILGLIYFEQKMYDKAQQMFKKQLQCNPKEEHDCYMNLGGVYFSQKDYKKAVQYYKKANKANPKSIVILKNLAIAYQNDDNIKESDNCYEQIVKLEPNNYRGHYGLAESYRKKKKYAQAEVHFAKCIDISFDNPLFHINRARNFKEMNKMNEAFTQLEETKKLMAKFSDRMLFQKYQLRENSIKIINDILKELQSVQELNRGRQMMTPQDQQILSQINDDFFENLINNNSGKNNSELDKIKQQIKMLQNRMTYAQKDIKQIKSEFQLDNKFQKLLSSDQKNSSYYKNLFSIMSTSVQAYRAVNLGIVQAGNGVSQLKSAGYVSKITKMLKIAQNVPMVSSFCSILVKVGQFYLNQSQQYVINSIVQATSDLYNEKKLTKAVNQTILYMADNKQILQRLNKQQNSYENKPWYQKIGQTIGKITQKIKSDVFKMPSYDVNTEKSMNLAMRHCAQIIICMIVVQNRQKIKSSNNVLLQATKIWLVCQKKQNPNLYEQKKYTYYEQPLSLKKVQSESTGTYYSQKPSLSKSYSSSQLSSQTILLTVQRANLYQDTRSFTKMNPYCKVMYNKNKFQTQVDKGGHQTPSWSFASFKLKKQPNPTQIFLFVIDKPTLFGKQRFLGEAVVYDTDIKLNQNISYDLMDQGNKVGEIKVIFQISRN